VGAVVKTTFDGHVFTTTADPEGIWRQQLPPMQASMRAYNLSFASSSGDVGELNEVLFGDVYICGGQSNMEYSMVAVTNKTYERQLANDYPHIRLFSVGHSTQSSTPLNDLKTVWQPWEVASNETIWGHYAPGHTMFGTFSAVCWFFGREVSHGLDNEVPIGLVLNNWGGTKVEQWSPTDAIASCNSTGFYPNHAGAMYNAMIVPYAVGPMAISGFTWYQGEEDTANAESAEHYSCLFPSMISSWRALFKQPSVYFGFVQLSTWCANESLPLMREAQLSALSLPNIGFATNADHGDGCNIHPPSKQFVGKRLGNSALALVYNQTVPWRSPSYASASISVAAAGTVRVSVALKDVGADGLTTDVLPYNTLAYPWQNETALNCSALSAPGYCAWGAVEVEGLGWLNASVTATGRDLSMLVLEAALPDSAVQPNVMGTAYAFGPVPMMNAYDKASGLPVLPWNRSLHKVTFVV